MTGGLQSTGGGAVVRCALCPRPASGPCARCRRSVCADCCELTTGATTFALCLECAGDGASLRRPWLHLTLWLLAIAVGVVALGLGFAALR